MIGIIFIADVTYCPYLRKYTQVLDELKTEYEVLYWNRDGQPNDYPLNYTSFNMVSKLDRPPLFKIFDFWKFKTWVKHQIDIKKYKKLIILSTLSGVIITKTLINKYKGRYIFDIRDYSYENINFFLKKEEKLIKESFFTCISSEGFKEFLPSGYSYLTVHNFNNNEVLQEKNFVKKKYGDTLNLIFVGGVRYFNHQVQIINNLKNDRRFNLVYHGSGPDLERFTTYCKENSIKNVTFTGKYDNSEKKNLLKNADILNNSYKSSKVMEIKYAISNKYYDGLIYRIPQLVETDTFKCEKVENLGVGIGLNESAKNFANKLYEYYFKIDEKTFNENCEKGLKSIIKDDELYIKKIREFIDTPVY